MMFTRTIFYMMVCFGANQSGLDMGSIYWGGVELGISDVCSQHKCVGRAALSID
jgi:hypothetical protein